MRKNFILSFGALAALSLMLFSGCEKTEDKGEELTFRGSGNMAVNVGQTATVNIKTGNGEYKAVSNDPAIAIAFVDGTKVNVTGVVAGQTDIKVSDAKGRSATLKVTVSDEALDLTLDWNKAKTEAGKTTTVNVVQGNGGYSAVSDKTNIATVSVSGTVITITGVANGTATVTVTDAKGKTATIAVTIETLRYGANLGANNYIKVPFVETYAAAKMLNAVPKVTMEALVKIDSWSFLNTIMGWEGNFLLRANKADTPTFNASFGNGNSSDDLHLWGAEPFTLGKWYHLAFVFDGEAKTIKFYVDGLEVGTENTNATTIDMGFVHIGDLEFKEFFIGRSSDQNRPLNGAITQARLWNKALTAEEVAQVKGKEIATNTAGLLAYWKLNDNTSITNIVDATGNGYDGTAGSAITDWVVVDY